MKNNIARKLIIYTILFSSVITLVITALQLYTELQYDIKGINQSLQQIKTSYQKSLTQSVWVADKNQLQVILNGITELPDIVYSSIRNENDENISSGFIPNAETIEFKTDLHYNYNNTNLKIGEFTVVASLTDVYSRLINRLWIILLSNALKTSLVAVFIYFLFFNLVTKHLTKISKFSENSDVLTNAETLTLDRHTTQHDEFDTVVNSINNMHNRLHEQISEINKQKQHLSQTLNSIGDAVITTDNNGNVTRLNPVAEKLTGWTNKQAQQQPLRNVFPIIDTTSGKPIPYSVEKVLATGEAVYLSNHTTLIAKDNSEYQIADSAAPILDNNKILGMVLVFNDVTEQYKMREALHESEQRLRQLTENLKEVFWLGSPDWNEIIYISPAYEKVWGKSTQSLYEHPRSWLEPIHPDDKQQVLNDIPDNLDGIIDCIEFSEFRIQKNDSEEVWIKARAYPIRDADGNVIRIAGIAEDITDQKCADETIRRSQKMDALGKLTGGIAHDYNNMLGIVLGYADILHNMLDGQPVLQKYAKNISHAGERGAKLTRKLLDFSRDKSTDESKTNINTVLIEEQHMLEKTLTARIKLELNLDKNLCPVYLDNSELEDAILNISINAMHAISGNGFLKIETHCIKIDTAEANALSLNSGNYVRLRFTDSGCGMDEKTREKIFDPFYSTKGDKGTGLGLSQVYGFVNRCGGAITVNSTLQQGSSFMLYFPCHTGNSKNIENIDAIEHSEQSGGGSILVVDDEHDLIQLVSDILTQQGYRVFQAENAQQALKIASSEHIDVMLSDVIMPDMDGYTLASQIQNEHPEIKVQLTSGFSKNYDQDHPHSALSKNLLEKPYTSDALLEKIRHLLAEKK